MRAKLFIIALILLIAVTACSLQAQPAPAEILPTYTPYPTYTPFPQEVQQTYEFVLVYGPDQLGFSGIEDFDQACQIELGEDSRQADWIDLQFYNHDGFSLEELGNALNMERDGYAWISLASQVNFSDSDFYAVIYHPTREVFFDGLDALPDWSEYTFVLSHRSADPMLLWDPVLCILEEQFDKMP